MHAPGHYLKAYAARGRQGVVLKVHAASSLSLEASFPQAEAIERLRRTLPEPEPTVCVAIESCGTTSQLERSARSVVQHFEQYERSLPYQLVVLRQPNDGVDTCIDMCLDMCLELCSDMCA